MSLDELKEKYKDEYEEWQKNDDTDEDFETWIKKKHHIN